MAEVSKPNQLGGRGGRELGTGHFENDHHFFVGLVELNEVIDLCCVSDKVVLRTILRCVGF